MRNHRRNPLTLTLLGVLAALLTGTGGALAAQSPAPTHKISSMELGNGHALLVYDDGSLASWGWNKAGQLGNGTLFDQYFPTKVDTVNGAKQAAAGDFCSMVLAKDGTVLQAGQRCPGAAYDDEASKSFVAKSGTSGFTRLSFDGLALALKNDGTVWSWGNDWQRAYSDDFSIPLQVEGLGDIVAIDAAKSHALALGKDGTVWSWGDNAHGEIGNGTKEPQLSPAQIPGLSGVRAISASRFRSAALLTDGTVRIWGAWNDTVFLKPVTLKGMDRVLSIDVGGSSLLATRADGTVWQFGGEPAYAKKPGKVPGLSHIVQVAAGEGSSLALAKDGTLYEWGYAALPGKGTYFSYGNDNKPAAVPAAIGFEIDGEMLSLALSPGFHHGLLMIPRSELWKSLGVEVKMTTSAPDKKNYNAVYTTWTISKGDKSVSYVRSKTGVATTVNGATVKEAPQPVTFGSGYSSILMLPFEFVCEALDIPFRWNEATRTYSF